MTFALNRDWAWGMAAVIFMTALSTIDPAGLVGTGREAAFEAMGTLVPRPPLPDRVRVVDIDRESLARLGPWPWRRSEIARLVDRIAAGRPSAIAVDILLSGADRNGPAALAQELGRVSGRPDLAAGEFQDDDRVLADAVARAGNVVLGIVLDDAGRDAAPIPPPFAVEGETNGIIPRSSAGLVAAHEALAAGAAGIGVLSFHDGPLGRVASVPLFAIAAGEVFPGLAVEAIRVAENASLLVLRSGPRRVMVGSVEVPADVKAEMRLYISSPQSWTARTVPAWKLLTEDAPAAGLQDRIVLIGSTAPEAGAFLPVAGAPLAPTVQMQAEVVEQILSGAFLTRPAGSRYWEPAAMLLLGGLAVTLAVHLAPAAAALSSIALLGAWLATVAVAFAAGRLLIDPTGVVASVIVGGNAAAFAAFARTRALKAAILQKFERYVPPEVVARLLREPQTLRLDGELREVTALITDVESFSRMTETSDPRVLVEALDGYFDGVTELVVRHGGMVDKIAGDAVLAFFNIPAPLADHTDAAVECAEAIVAWTEAFRHRLGPAAMGFGRTRCGIETGQAIVGDVGGRRRLDYTAYGVVVNKAARFQEANKFLGSSICIGPVAAKMLGRRKALRPLGRIRVRGMEEQCEVFEPWPEGTPPDIRRYYDAAIALSETEPGRARELLAAVAEQMGDDRVIAAGLKRLES